MNKTLTMMGTLALTAVVALSASDAVAAKPKSTAKKPMEPKLLETITVEHAIPWWGTESPLNPLRMPPPPKGAKVEYYDLTGDGKPNMLRTILPNGMPVQWIDDDGDMKIGDLSGDTDNDCVMIDRNRDGNYGGYSDLVIDWNDTDGDGKADMQVVVDNVPESKKMDGGGGHYMWVLDTDKDNILNYIDWNKLQLRCWVHNGIADFYEDYHGKSLFLKIHSTPEKLNDVRLNWENPFLFYDHDGDGLSEMAIRFCDTPKKGPGTSTLSGKIDWVSLAFDLDNDNRPENEFDFDMTIRFVGPGFDYMDQVHKFDNMRGLPEADKFFMDPKWRQNTELIYPDHEAAWDLTFNRGDWKKAWFVFDEDGDCKRWERVELYEDKDPFRIGGRNGGVDNNVQADAAGDRGEWDNDNSGKGQLYIGRFDGKMHLYGAEWGIWRIDQRGNSYQGMGGIYDGYGPGRQQKNPDKFATVKYADTDNNGFIDEISYDLDGDTKFEHVVSLLKLGIDDRCEVINTAEMKYGDFVSLNTRMSEDLWYNAQKALKVADKYGINTSWYALLKSPKSIRQKYDNGYWLQFYIYRDLLDMAYRRNDTNLVNAIDKAYYQGDWNQLL